VTPDCRWTRPRIIAHLDGELAKSDAELVSEHLLACPDCRVVSGAERALTERVRAAAGAERAPERLAERIRRGLAEAETETETAAPAAALPRKPRASRRAMGWSLAAALAAAILLVVGTGIFWPGSGRSLVTAMADEHREHSNGSDPRLLDLTSTDAGAIEAYLAGKLGVAVKLPSSSFPKRRGATCCRQGDRSMGLVACFCERRSHAVTLFVVKSEGLSLRGLDQVQSGGRDFWSGSAGECRALLWKSGPVCYAVVGDFKNPADHLELASRTAAALEARPGK